jgi:Fe-S cluster assembly iron-binding protein IscA
MLNVTDAAAARLHEMAASGPEGKMLRLEKEGTHLEFQWDTKKPGDTTIAHEGTTVLVFSKNVDRLLRNKTMNVRQTESGEALTLT